MTTPALIIGAGPVGLTMAAELARFGVPVRIVDRSASRSTTSKALVLWSRSLELIDRMGCGDAFVAAGMKVHAANAIAGGRRIGQVRFDGVASPHAYALMIAQSETERLMEAQLGNLGVTVERETELLRFTAGADAVTAVLRTRDGPEEVVETPWLIGSDGAHSAVRRGLGMQFEGETLPSEWVLADVHLAGVPIPQDELGIFWHAEGVLVLFPITPGRYRIIADIGETTDDAARHEPTLAEIQDLLDRRGPGGIVATDPIWLAGFRINERKVADYRAGRVFLAGDAAHIHSPAGGQGMNTGMQDAFNLAWKLALVTHGLAREEPLLGSYSTERSAVGRMVLRNAGRMTAAATLRGEFRQGLRNAVASTVLRLPPARRAIGLSLSELAIGYPDSPLTVPGGRFQRGPAAGDRAPVRSGEAGFGAGNAPRFALCTAPSPEATALIARHAAVLEPAPRAPFSEGATSLVRPDGYIALVTRDWGAAEAWLGRVVA